MMVPNCDMATEDDSAQARDLYREGVRHYEAGELAAAEKAFESALALDPGRASTSVSLASTRLRLGRTDEALTLADAVLQADPRNIDALGLRGAALATLGMFPNALEAFDAIIALKPRHTQAWTMRGNVLRELGRMEEANESFNRAAEDSPDPETLRYYGAASGEGEPPPSAPRAYVQSLFDNYAASYDSELVDTLNYRAPQLLADGLAALGRRFGRALDLGCGTGLCAPLLKPMVDELVGVDLAPQMLEQARQRNLYDELHDGDVAEYIASSAGPWDLAVAADVFVYVGRLEPVFEALAPKMAPGGVFCFSLEEHAGPEPLVLQTSRRYAHSEAYIRELAAAHGFRVQQATRAPIRDQRATPIVGLCAWLVRDGG